MFAATQDFLTQAFDFVAVASVVWLLTEYLYFAVAYPDPAPEAPQDTAPEAPEAPQETAQEAPQETAPEAPEAAQETTAEAPETPPEAPEAPRETAPDIAKVKANDLRKLAVARGIRGAGRWKKADLIAALT